MVRCRPPRRRRPRRFDRQPPDIPQFLRLNRRRSRRRISSYRRLNLRPKLLPRNPSIFSRIRRKVRQDQPTARIHRWSLSPRKSPEPAEPR